MNDFLDTLAMDATKTIDSGYYQTKVYIKQPKIKLKQAILDCQANPVITEIKAASPSLGTIRTQVNPKEIVQAMEKGGAVGISVLTEPKHFHGSLSTIIQAREATNLPIIMKDIILVADQIEVAAQIGANAVLLIQALFDRGCSEMSVDKTIAFAHSKGLEVLLETHTEGEFRFAVETEADLVGINNRNLGTLKIDLNTTKEILKRNDKRGKVVISESGIKTSADLQFLKGCGASAFLIGSAIMSTENIEEKVMEFVKG
ncbi:MAG TPA: indole-3-glycerol-phosphate synthase [Candidatus Bathyarchaeia archaeon]